MLADAARILFVHAHPDDETLWTGALIAHLARSGRRCFVLTATRGELGEIRPESPAALAGPDGLAAAREDELAQACAALGVAGRCFLGDPPARAASEPRRYTDSGMVWIDEAARVAGPGTDAGPDALTRADPDAVAADIAAYADAVGADAVVSYDADGGYFHPDHVALHAPSRTAASALGLPFWEVVSDPAGAGEWHDLSAELATVQAALTAYPSQLVVVGDELVFSGGQRHPIPTRIGLRRR